MFLFAHVTMSKTQPPFSACSSPGDFFWSIVHRHQVIYMAALLFHRKKVSFILYKKNKIKLYKSVKMAIATATGDILELDSE